MDKHRNTSCVVKVAMQHVFLNAHLSVSEGDRLLRDGHMYKLHTGKYYTLGCQDNANMGQKNVSNANVRST
jgi:hypothetical protein